MRATLYLTAVLLVFVTPPAEAAGCQGFPRMVQATEPGAPAASSESNAGTPSATPAVSPAPTSPAATSAGTAAPSQTLVGLAAWNQLIGNSITGKEGNETLTEYYTADGTAKSMTGNEISQGKWLLAGELVCFQYSDEPKPECYHIEVHGDTVTYYDEAGTGTRYEILKGNPKGL